MDGIPSLIPTLKAKAYQEHVQGRLSVIVVRWSFGQASCHCLRADGLTKPTLSTSMRSTEFREKHLTPLLRPYVVLEVGNMELRSTKQKSNTTVQHMDLKIPLNRAVGWSDLE